MDNDTGQIAKSVGPVAETSFGNTWTMTQVRSPSQWAQWQRLAFPITGSTDRDQAFQTLGPVTGISSVCHWVQWQITDLLVTGLRDRDREQQVRMLGDGGASGYTAPTRNLQNIKRQP
jgi:hypothetical protein